jgi:hypothetical protein
MYEDYASSFVWRLAFFSGLGGSTFGRPRRRKRLRMAFLFILADWVGVGEESEGVNGYFNCEK